MCTQICGWLLPPKEIIRQFERAPVRGTDGPVRGTVGPATTQNLVVKFDGEICGGVLVENASDDFPQQKRLENLLPNFAGSSPPISPKTSPTSPWKSLVLRTEGPVTGTCTKPLLIAAVPLAVLIVGLRADL